MKKIILVYFLFYCYHVKAQDFITKWDLSYPSSNATSIQFDVVTSGAVNYSWETIPAGASGVGNFSGTAASITGLPIGAVIRLKIYPVNFKQIVIITEKID